MQVTPAQECQGWVPLLCNISLASVPFKFFWAHLHVNRPPLGFFHLPRSPRGPVKRRTADKLKHDRFQVDHCHRTSVRCFKIRNAVAKSFNSFTDLLYGRVENYSSSFLDNLQIHCQTRWLQCSKPTWSATRTLLFLIRNTDNNFASVLALTFCHRPRSAYGPLSRTKGHHIGLWWLDGWHLSKWSKTRYVGFPPFQNY